jgi:G:T-mismatch repair DNA endonuclease (very short patch repair protein)
MNAEAKKRYKDIDFPFICPLTKREFNSSQGLSCYVTKTLKIPHSEYYDNYVNHRDNECFFCGDKGKFISISKGYRNLCENPECVKRSFNSHSVEGIMYRMFVSREEAENLFKLENERQLSERIKTQNKLRKDDPLWDKKRSRNCKEFWIEKGYSEEESILKSKDVMNEIHKKTSKKLKSNPEKYVSKYPTKIEYWIKRGFSKDEAKKKISEIQNRFSLKSCIEKYGEDEGNRIFNERQEKWINTLNSKSDEEKIEINRKKLFNNSGYSKVSQSLFWRVFDHFQSNDIRFEELNSEIIRYDKNNKKHYKYDYVDFTLKKCIEFNGDYWHCNPNKYNETFIHPIMKITANEIWNKDNMKNKWMEDRGFKILVVWESEYKKNPDETLQKCINFLHE